MFTANNPEIVPITELPPNCMQPNIAEAAPGYCPKGSKAQPEPAPTANAHPKVATVHGPKKTYKFRPHNW